MAHNTRAELKAKIIKVLESTGKNLSRSQIAQEVNLKKTPYLLEILAELVKEEKISCYQTETPQGFKMFMYYF